MSGVLLTILMALYFAPTIIAALRHHHQAIAIGVLNLCLGWTLIGWVVALVWAVIREREPGSPIVIQRAPPSEPFNRYP